MAWSSPIEMLIIASLILNSLCLFSLFIFWRKHRRMVREFDRQIQRIKDMKQALHDQQHDTQAFIERFDVLDSQINQVNEQQEDLTNNLSNSSAYKQALKMIEMGASLEDVMSTCEMGRAEASLLFNLQGYKKIGETSA